MPFIQRPQEGEAFEHASPLDQSAAFLNVIPEDSHVLTQCAIRLATTCRDGRYRSSWAIVAAKAIGPRNGMQSTTRTT